MKVSGKAEKPKGSSGQEGVVGEGQVPSKRLVTVWAMCPKKVLGWRVRVDLRRIGDGERGVPSSGMMVGPVGEMGVAMPPRIRDEVGGEIVRGELASHVGVRLGDTIEGIGREGDASGDCEDGEDDCVGSPEEVTISPELMWSFSEDAKRFERSLEGVVVASPEVVEGSPEVVGGSPEVVEGSSEMSVVGEEVGGSS
jgi:hypothetical protein